MKKILLPALALVTVVVLALLLWKMDGAGTVEPSGEHATLEAHGVESGPRALEGAHELASITDPAAPGASEEARASAASAPGAERWNLEDSVWIEGSVRSPAGCTDGELEVFACGEATTPEALARWLDSLAGDGDVARAKQPFLARRPVSQGGTFRLPFPPDTGKGWVLARGRYQHGERALEVDLAAAASGVVLETECGAFVAGTLALPAGDDATDAQRAEIDGIAVVLSTLVEGISGDTSRLRGTRRTAHAVGGRVEFRALPAAAKYKLRVEPKTLAAAEVRTEALPGGRDHALPIGLRRGGTIRGVVRGPDGAIEGATVEATTRGQWFGFDDPVARAATSGDDGSFELLAVTPGEVRVRAKLADWLEGEGTKLEVQDGGTSEGLVVELARGAAVSGTLSWPDGKPVAEVSVELSFDMSAMVGMGAFNALRGAKGTARTDAAGSFRVGGLGVGPFTLKAEALPAGVEIEDAALRRKSMHRARADGVAPGTSGLALVLRAPIGLAGRVLGADGAPVREFKLFAGRIAEGAMGSVGQEKLEERFEHEEGRFLLTGMLEGTWKLYARAEGFGPGEPLQLELPRAESEPELVLTLVPAATVRGKVLAPGGDPVAGASVVTDTGVPNWQQMIAGAPDLPETQSGPDGTFELAGLPAGKLALIAKAKDHAPSTALALELAAGQTVEDAVLTLHVGGRLTGVVYQEGGAPGVGMMVQINESKRFEQHLGFADGEGRFEFEHVAAGQWQVVAMPVSQGGGDGSQADAVMGMVSKMKTAMVDIVDGEDTHIVLGAPPADPVRVHGRVTHAGAPYTGSMVAFLPDGKDVLGGMKMAQVGADGGYSVVLDKPGTYSASVQKLGGAGMGQQSTIEYSCDVPEEKEHELDFELPTSRISGRVRGPGGDPLSGARVSLHPQAALAVGTIWGGQYTELVTDAEGRYDIEALRPGTYTVIAGGVSVGGMFGLGEAGFGREVRPGIKLAEGEWLRDFDFRLKVPGSCEVTVVDEAGAPVPEAAIFARTNGGDLLDRFSFLVTDGNGRRKYAGLTPGDYTFSARKELVTSQESGRVRVEEGAVAAVKLVLQGGTVLLVTVTGEEDQPVKATISVQDDQGREVGGMLALADVMKLFGSGEGLNSKERRIGPVPPGKYKVKASDAQGRSATRMVTLNGQPERKLTIRLE